MNEHLLVCLPIIQLLAYYRLQTNSPVNDSFNLVSICLHSIGLLQSSPSIVPMCLLPNIVINILEFCHQFNLFKPCNIHYWMASLLSLTFTAIQHHFRTEITFYGLMTQRKKNKLHLSNLVQIRELFSQFRV